jgi:hypothetical protein
MFTTIISTLALILIGFLAWSIVGSRGEQPKYSVVSVKNNIDVRDYAPMIVAEVEATGEREEAITRGFRYPVPRPRQPRRDQSVVCLRHWRNGRLSAGLSNTPLGAREHILDIRMRALEELC